jgi:steroid delta-isomerase-like uncharacterized protein
MTITTTSTKDIVSDYIDRLFTKGDADAADELISPDFINHDPPFGQSADRDGMRAAQAIIRASFPDWHSTPFLYIAEDDLVVEAFVASGTHTGAAMMGVEPSGRELTLQGINIFRLRNGRIIERWGRVDEAGFQAQLTQV